MDIALVFFSATGNTRYIARIIGDEFRTEGATVTFHDITTADSRKKGLDVSRYDAIIFGFPVHSLRAPRVIREWLTTLAGDGMRCAMFFTFGGFMVHPAHYSTAQILEKQGFVVVSSAEFPGRHTYNLGGWNAFPDRPDHRERALAQEYAAAASARFTAKDSQTVSELDQGMFTDEQLDAFEHYRFKIITEIPGRKTATCSLCGLCESLCPTEAMDHLRGTADPARCITCLRCVDSCPDKVITINSTRESWPLKLSMSRTTEQEVNSQRGRIYLPQQQMKIITDGTSTPHSS